MKLPQWKKFMLFALVAMLTALIGVGATAQNLSPIGLWKTIDDATGKPRALVRITENHGELNGKIEKLFREPDEEADPKCTECEDERKNQPVLGMVFLSGLKRDGDEYNGGTILDPKNGKIYKAKITVIDNGKKLEVRGYIGFSLLGRTQTWLRQE